MRQNGRFVALFESFSLTLSMYSPTISSFNTTRDRITTRTPGRIIPLENILPPTYFPDNDTRNRVKSLSSNFVNRASSMIPYMGFMSRLVQVMINKATLVWILVALNIKLFGSSVIFSLEQVKKADNISCLYLDNDSTKPQFLSYLSNANLAYAESIMTTMYSSALENLENLEAAYTAIVNSTIRAAVYSADNATTSLRAWTTEELDFAIANTTVNLKSLESSLSSISSALESSAVFESNGLGNATNISLAAFNLKIPTAISSNLVSSNDSLDSYMSEFLTLKNSATQTLKNDFSNLYDQAAGILSNSTENSTVSYSCSEIVLGYNNAIKKVQVVIVGVLAAYLTLAALAVIPTAVYEYALWHRQLQIAGIIETQKEQIYDVMEFLEDFQSLIKSNFNEFLSKMHIVPTPTDSVLLKWLVSFTLSRAMNFLISAACSVMICYLGDVAILNVVRKTAASLSTSLDVPSSTSSSSQQLTNANVTDIIHTAGNQFYKDVVSYKSALSTKLTSILSSAGLPAADFDYILTGSLVIASLNQSQLTENITQITAITDSKHGIPMLINHFNYILNAHLIVSLSFFGAWLVMILGAFHYVAYRHSKINK